VNIFIDQASWRFDNSEEVISRLKKIATAFFKSLAMMKEKKTRHFELDSESHEKIN